MTIQGARLIAAERSRQTEAEGYTQEHDAEHDRGELVSAAIWYATRHASLTFDGRAQWPLGWQFKPDKDDPVHDLVRAGALIAAEIDRLLAVAAQS